VALGVYRGLRPPPPSSGKSRASRTRRRSSPRGRRDLGAIAASSATRPSTSGTAGPARTLPRRAVTRAPSFTRRRRLVASRVLPIPASPVMKHDAAAARRNHAPVLLQAPASRVMAADHAPGGGPLTRAWRGGGRATAPARGRRAAVRKSRGTALVSSSGSTPSSLLLPTRTHAWYWPAPRPRRPSRVQAASARDARPLQGSSAITGRRRRSPHPPRFGFLVWASRRRSGDGGPQLVLRAPLGFQPRWNAGEATRTRRAGAVVERHRGLERESRVPRRTRQLDSRRRRRWPRG
jgi:hypothetical protein